MHFHKMDHIVSVTVGFFKKTVPMRFYKIYALFGQFRKMSFFGIPFRVDRAPLPLRIPPRRDLKNAQTTRTSTSNWRNSWENELVSIYIPLSILMTTTVASSSWPSMRRFLHCSDSLSASSWAVQW